MMLVAHPLVMPSTVHNSKKRKGHNDNADLLPPKRAALDHPAVKELKDKPKIIEREKMLLPAVVHEDEIPHSSKGYSEKRKANVSAERTSRLSSHHTGGSGITYRKAVKHGSGRDFKAGNGFHSSVTDRDSSVNLSEERPAPLLPEGTLNDNHGLGSEVDISTDVKDTGNANWAGCSGDLMPHSVKEPSVVITNYKVSDSAGKPPDYVYETGNYMRRMASLNARARVTAMMESDGRRSKGRAHNNGMGYDKKRLRGALSIHRPIRSSGRSLTSPLTRRGRGMFGPSSSSSSSSSSSVTSSPETDFSHDSEMSVTEPQVINTLLTLAMAAATACEPEDVQYNSLGLLYNGDTLHPNSRVFYSSDTDLTIPGKVIPKVVPSHDRFVKAAVDDAISMRYVCKKRKGAKANNGWSVMGNPIKTIEYYEGSVLVTRRYYAGIRRNNAKEIICVRDSVVIRSGDSKKDEKPYVAKLASIWQEQPGHLMMTVMWYYRPDEMDSNISQSTSFKEDELLASQHNDDNSVACIEEKCYVLGISQYCRYQAYIHCKRAGCISKTRSIVPKRVQRSSRNLHSDTEGDPLVTTTAQSPHHLRFSKDIDVLSGVDPDLVCLCHRGYNHYAGKLVSRAFSK